MENALSYNAMMAWTAFGMRDYPRLAKHGNEIYNYFSQHPQDLLTLDSPLLIGKVFQVCLGFQEPDEDIQEVRAENAFLCFSQALKSDKTSVHDEALARLMILLIRDQKHLKGYVERACQNENFRPYSMIGMLHDDMPLDMPLATNTKMLFVAYFLYEGIQEKLNVDEEFVNPIEREAFRYVKAHVLDNCNQLTRTEPKRMVELGEIVFDKICKKLQRDIEEYSEMI